MNRRQFNAAALLAAAGVARAGRAQAATRTDNQPAYDAIIYGATLAGIMAALRLAKRGMSSLVLEPTGHVGGIVAGGLVKTDIPNDIRALSGLTLSAFFTGIGVEYGSTTAQYRFEPKVASRVAVRLLEDAGATVVLNHRINGSRDVLRQGGRIAAIMVAGRWTTASFFIDASYEGDLMAAAGVPYRVGRESTDTYDESYAGYLPAQAFRRNGFQPNTGYPVRDVPVGAAGDADDKVQAYNFRGVLSKNADRLPFEKPTGYDPDLFVHMGQQVAYRGITGLSAIVTETALLPNNKYQTNQGLFIGFDLPGASWDYADGSWSRRDEIIGEHVRWHQGQLYWFTHEPSLPSSFRTDSLQFGLPSDEFVDSPYGVGFPHALYIREGRRMAGHYVLTQQDLLTPNNTKTTSVCCWKYGMDCHVVQYYPEDTGTIVGEGTLTGTGGNAPVDLFQIPAEVLFPARGGIANLAVPVCFSASHVGYLSPRMEPNFSMLGEAAGELAAQSIRTGRDVQDYDYPQLATALREFGSTLSVPS